ncbi:MAG TPA: type II secretion system F family protein [Bryobacterales bacterium]|nr:type II secretion system F family protein [Bryobacterales bacterium]
MATTFTYRAIAPDGKLRTGTLSGETDRAVAQELRRQGLTPIAVAAGQGKKAAFELPRFGRGKRARDVLFFTQELATLLGAGVPLDRALAITAELTERAQFRNVVGEVLRSIKGGRSLADSLTAHKDYFSELYVNMIRAGEASGSLALVAERLAEFERSRDELRNYIISSMIYPILLTCVGTASVIVLLDFVIPRFAAVFAESHIPMPLPTQMLLKASQIVKTFGLPAIAALVAAFAAFRAYVRTPQGRLAWDQFRLKVPLLGDALRKADTARFARSMSTLVANSVPLVQALGIARAILTNRIIAGSLEAVAQGIKRGEGIAGPLRRTGQFPALAGHLLSVGEETGRLDQMFTRMAEIYEKDTREAIKRFTALFEPLVILFMGVVVGAMILSIMLAITSINEIAM